MKKSIPFFISNSYFVEKSHRKNKHFLMFLPKLSYVAGYEDVVMGLFY